MPHICNCSKQQNVSSSSFNSVRKMFNSSAATVQPTAGSLIPAASSEEITTIFVVGFPDDMQEREFQNMFLFSPGFEAATLKIPSNFHSAETAEDSGFHQASSQASRKQIIGFAKFRSRSEAMDARDVLNGRRVDPERGCVLKAEMAKKNLHTKRSAVGFHFGMVQGYPPQEYFQFTGPPSATSPAFPFYSAVNGAPIHGNSFPQQTLLSGRPASANQSREFQQFYEQSGSFAGLAATGQSMSQFILPYGNMSQSSDYECFSPDSGSTTFPAPLDVGSGAASSGITLNNGENANGPVEHPPANTAPVAPINSPFFGSAEDANQFTHSLDQLSRRCVSDVLDDDGSGFADDDPYPGEPTHDTSRATTVAQNTLNSNGAHDNLSPSIGKNDSIPDLFSGRGGFESALYHNLDNMRQMAATSSMTNPTSSSNNVSHMGMQNCNSSHNLMTSFPQFSVPPMLAMSVSNQAPANSVSVNAQSLVQPSYARSSSGMTDQNIPPCNTLYVGNLPPNASEDELRSIFSSQIGFKRLLLRNKGNSPMCFVEFESIAHASQVMVDLNGHPLSNSTKGKLLSLPFMYVLIIIQVEYD